MNIPVTPEQVEAHFAVTEAGLNDFVETARKLLSKGPDRTLAVTSLYMGLMSGGDEPWMRAETCLGLALAAVRLAELSASDGVS
jgi:hypothetical protein